MLCCCKKKDTYKYCVCCSIKNFIFATFKTILIVSFQCIQLYGVLFKRVVEAYVCSYNFQNY